MPPCTAVRRTDTEGRQHHGRKQRTAQGQGGVRAGLDLGERILAQGVSFLVSIVLARILMPEEYGIVALVLVFLNIADVFVSNGFGESLVQKQHATETDFSTVFYCSFAFSWLVYAVLFASAGWVADYYANELLCPVLRVLALKIPLASVSSIQHAYVSKHMIFKKFFFSSLGGTLLSGGWASPWRWAAAACGRWWGSTWSTPWWIPPCCS